MHDWLCKSAQTVTYEQMKPRISIHRRDTGGRICGMHPIGRERCDPEPRANMQF